MVYFPLIPSTFDRSVGRSWDCKIYPSSRGRRFDPGSKESIFYFFIYSTFQLFSLLATFLFVPAALIGTESTTSLFIARRTHRSQVPCQSDRTIHHLTARYEGLELSTWQRGRPFLSPVLWATVKDLPRTQDIALARTVTIDNVAFSTTHTLRIDMHISFSRKLKL